MTLFHPSATLQTLIDRCCEIVGAAGGEAYVVGGTVRDVLLGRPARDLDLAVGGDSMAVAHRIADAFGGHFVELDEVHVVARVVLGGGVVQYVDVVGLQGSLAEDLARRDFTIDALAVPLGGGEVVDVCGGLDDLASRMQKGEQDRPSYGFFEMRMGDLFPALRGNREFLTLILDTMKVERPAYRELHAYVTAHGWPSGT